MIAHEQFLITWNNRFHKDRLFRKKYGIAFGSKQHREINQIDVFLDILEDKMFEKYTNQFREEERLLNVYKTKHQVLKEIELGDKKWDDLFDKIDVTKMQDS